MAILIKAVAGGVALILLIATLLGQLLALGGALLAAVKFAVVVIFLCVLTLIVFFILRDRLRHRRESNLS